MRKKLIYILLLFSFFFIPTIVRADNLTEEVDISKKIYDFANLLTDEEESEIYLLEKNFIEQSDLDLAIVTLDNNPYGNSLDDTKTYAVDFYNYNLFGKNSTRDGIIVIIDKSSKSNSLYTFGKAQEIYDNQKVNSINNSISTFISEENYYQMIKVYITKLKNYAKDEEPEEELICNDENDNKYKCLTPKVDNSKKVYDFADLLTDEEEKNLFILVEEYIKKYNLDMALVTINENPYGVSDYYSQMYAQDFYYYNRFGVGKTQDGVILLIDMSNRYIYFTTKGNAILVYDDDRKERVLDAAYENIKEGNYFLVYKKAINKISEFAEKGSSDSNKYYCINEETGDYYKCKEAPKSVNWGIALLIGLAGSLIPAFVHTRKYRGIKLATDANTYLKEHDIDTKTDQFLTTFTSRVRRNHDSSGSRGGFGGGSSTSHGSGGSFGGGGRHF